MKCNKKEYSGFFLSREHMIVSIVFLKPRSEQNAACEISKTTEPRVKGRRPTRSICADFELWVSVSAKVSQPKH